MSLRDILVTLVVLGTLPFVLRHAYIGVLLWTWISVMNPHKLAWGFAVNMQFAAIAAAVTLVSLATTRDRVRLPVVTPVVLLALFFAWTCVTTALAFFPENSADQLNKVAKIQLMTLVAMAVLYEKKHIRLFIWVNVLSLGFYGVKGGLYTLRGGGAGMVFGPPGGFIGGNNELALALVLAIPLMHFLRATSPHKLVRHGLLLMMVLSVIAAIGTQSRGALVALAAMGVVLWWRAPNKIVNGIAIAALSLFVWTFMPQSWHERMGTILTYQQDSSAVGRINAWETAINVANDRIQGGGYAMYEASVFSIYAPNPDERRAADPSIARAAHSIYFQVLGEHGYIGLALFLMLWVSVWRTATRLRKGTRDAPQTEWLYRFGGMAQVSLVGYAAGGAFLSLAYFDLPYNVLAALVAAQRWHADQGTSDLNVDARSSAQGRTSVGRAPSTWERTA